MAKKKSQTVTVKEDALFGSGKTKEKPRPHKFHTTSDIDEPLKKSLIEAEKKIRGLDREELYFFDKKKKDMK